MSARDGLKTKVDNMEEVKGHGEIIRRSNTVQLDSKRKKRKNGKTAIFAEIKLRIFHR